jgi:hypothetical protein
MCMHSGADLYSWTTGSEQRAKHQGPIEEEVSTECIALHEHSDSSFWQPDLP